MRKTKSLLNIIGSITSYFFAMIFNFVTHAYLIKKLGIEYSGINGLFTNIITMLSIVELGLGTTIIFKLYKPISEKNYDEINSWLEFYKICYRYVALVVTIIGLIIIPFVPIIIGTVSIKENIIVLYIISLLDVVLSYVMTYKRSLLYADQKNYIINVVHIGYIILLNIIQIILLYFFENYVVFLIVKILFRIGENIILNIIVDKRYPFIKIDAKQISNKEKSDVLSRIKAIFLQKLSFVINKGIDNIIISMLLGIVSVGFYTNYNTIVVALTGIIFQIISSLTASVGNLLTEKNYEKNYEIFKNINMLNSFLTGIGIVGFACAVDPFIKLWIGEKYLLDNMVVFSFCVYIYSDSIRRSITIFKEAAGICKEDRYMYIIMAVINLISSIVLCKIIGIPGVILGTALSYLFLLLYSYPKYIFIPIFRKRYVDYYIEMIKYIVFIIFSFVFSLIICDKVIVEANISKFFLNSIISLLVTSIVFVLFFKNSKEFKYYKNLFIRILKKNIKTI